MTLDELDEDVQAVRSLLRASNPAVERILSPAELAEARAAVADPPELPAPPAPLDPAAPRQGRRAVRWRLAIAGIAAAAALIVGVVFVRSGSDSPSTHPVLASYDATAEAGTARAAFEVTIEDTTVTGEGVGSFTSGEASGTAQLPPPFGEISFVSTGRIIYVQIPESFRPFAGGKPWAQLPEADLAALMKLFLNDVGLTAPFNPADMLAYIKGVSGDVTEAGTDTVRGVETTRYQARIELAKVAANLGEDAESALSDANLDLTLPADIWIDSEGRLRQLTMSLASPIAVTATFELWDFGTAVEVTPPPADEVGDISAILSGFFSMDD